MEKRTVSRLALCALFLCSQAKAAIFCDELFPAETLAASVPDLTGSDLASRVASQINGDERYKNLVKKVSCDSIDLDPTALGQLRGILTDIRSIEQINDRYIGSNHSSGAGIGDILFSLRVKKKQYASFTAGGQPRKIEINSYNSITIIANDILTANTAVPNANPSIPDDGDKEAYAGLTRAISTVEFLSKLTLGCKAAKLIEECKTAEAALLKSRDKGEFESSGEYKQRKKIFPLNEQKTREEFSTKAAAITADVAGLYAPQIQLAESELEQFLGSVRITNAPLTLSKYDADREIFNAKLEFGEEEREIVLGIPREEAPLAKQSGLKADIGYKLKAEKGSLAHQVTFISVTGPNRRLLYNWGEAAVPIAPARSREGSAPSLKLTLNDDSTVSIAGDGGEASISVAIINSSGTAYGAYLEISAGTVLHTPKIVFIGDLPSNSSRNVSFPVAAPYIASASLEKISIRVKEARGYDSNDVLLKIPLMAPGTPRLMIESASFQDASKDGVISSGEMVVVTFKIKNAGDGAAKKASFTLTNDDPNIIFQGSKQQDISLLPSGQIRSVQFTLMPNMSFTGDRMDLLGSLTSADKVEKYPLKIPVSKGGHNTIEYALTPAKDHDDLSLNNHRQRSLDQDSYAVVLGVEDYKKVGPVSFAQNDARKFREYAHKLMGIPNDPAHMYFMDSGVTLGELKKVFGKTTGWLAKRAKPTSRVVVFYAGHGVPDFERHSAYLIPEDGDPNYPRETGLSLSEMSEFLGTLPAKSISVFIDACFSGNDREGKSLLANARPMRIAVDQAVDTKANVAILTAASSSQISSADPLHGHGLFTYFLLKNISEAASSSLPMGELADRVRADVKKRAAELDREQEPQLMGSPSITLVP